MAAYRLKIFCMLCLAHKYRIECQLWLLCVVVVVIVESISFIVQINRDTHTRVFVFHIECVINHSFVIQINGCRSHTHSEHTQFIDMALNVVVRDCGGNVDGRTHKRQRGREQQ